jgi:indole-3-glycerol phosphate synthase
MFLERVRQVKSYEIEVLKRRFTNEDWRRVRELPHGRPFVKALREGGFALIAEVKPASPSAGIIREKVDPAEIALVYERAGAHAVSVLTDRTFFRGDSANLVRVKEAVKLPVLRKDFLLHPLQVLESKQLGADAILLIVRLLDTHTLKQLVSLAHELGMEVLAEVHSAEEIPAALLSGADVIGINHRNLDTLEVDLGVSEQLRPFLPPDLTVIAESGIRSHADVMHMKKAGMNGVLVGEWLMRQPDPGRAVRELLEGIRCGAQP